MSNSPFDASSTPKNYSNFFFRLVEVSTWPVLISVSLFYIKTNIILLMCKLVNYKTHYAIVRKSFEALPRFLI